MRFLAALGFAVATWVAGSLPAHAQEFTGAGSTFVYPLLQSWSEGYQRDLAASDYRIGGAGLDGPPPGSALDYEPVGSLAGTLRVKESAVDFGASDVPMTSDELAKLGLAQFPIAIGGIAVVVNIDGIAPGALRLSGALLADIFLGKITTWNDPAISALNPGVRLPDAGIAVIHRSDGSGTTFNFATYLASTNQDWAQKVGANTLLRWPVGSGAEGNDGMAVAVQQTANSIGYVDFARAMQMKLSYALLENSAGNFAAPGPASFEAAASSADWANARDFDLLLTGAPGASAYPILATVFALMPKQPAFPQRARAARNFLQWGMENGADEAAALGYVPLPPALVSTIKGYWTAAFDGDA